MKGFRLVEENRRIKSNSTAEVRRKIKKDDGKTGNSAGVNEWQGKVGGESVMKEIPTERQEEVQIPDVENQDQIQNLNQHTDLEGWFPDWDSRRRTEEPRVDPGGPCGFHRWYGDGGGGYAGCGGESTLECNGRQDICLPKAKDRAFPKTIGLVSDRDTKATPKTSKRSHSATIIAHIIYSREVGVAYEDMPFQPQDHFPGVDADWAGRRFFEAGI
ncbi:hypothetical protein CSAL01_10471 [Colletotrichum salicis]|uniref:Uncharacterized protein n=1 Tax=Colletotrichum salicis TaxID=1209931 RepID=A0A135UXL9_9PEZI|nr:hypothetical protein CSAL01_10471 [Colletotrichum salicis]